MCVKYNLPMTMSNLSNMPKDLNLDQGDTCKSKVYRSGIWIGYLNNKLRIAFRCGIEYNIPRRKRAYLGLKLDIEQQIVFRVYTKAKWSEKTLRIALARSGAEINGFLCF